MRGYVNILSGQIFFSVMESLCIRRYTWEDYPKVCGLDAPLFPMMGGHVLFRHLEELFPNFCFVAESKSSNELVGFIFGGVHYDDSHIGKLVRIGVQKGFQRKECGTSLTFALLDEMRQHKVKKVHLTVAETNHQAIAFYKKLGFYQSEYLENYFYPDTPRLVFEKEL